ncbi:hypothetical protein TNCV_4529871 [Trichonephila clavipes]|nr:hypothetical protein TNCV_4529871 [Trichonephila clavipes]
MFISPISPRFLIMKQNYGIMELILIDSDAHNIQKINSKLQIKTLFIECQISIRTNSLDLNPIEYIWDALRRRLGRSLWLEHRTPDRKAWVRCPMPPNTLRVPTEYVLVKSMGPKMLWAESRVQGTGEYFPPLHFHA